MSANTVKADLPPWREKPYEDTASLEFCRCREPVKLRKYLRNFVCALCSKSIVEKAS